MSIAENIKNIRLRFNLTQDELGEIAGVSGGAVSTWERGTAEPRMGAIQKIADKLNINKSDIIDDAVASENGIKSVYYLDPDAAELAQEIYEDENKRMLFSATRDISKEDMQFVIDMVERLKRNTDG